MNLNESPKLQFDPNAIFPLRLSPFEEYYHIDDRSDLPMTENNVWLFEGRVEPDLLRRALRRAAAREPLFFAKIARRRRKLFWVVDDETLKLPDLRVLHTDESIVSLRSGVVPLSFFQTEQEVGVRFKLVVGPDGFVVHIATNHSTADGTSVARFLGDWFAFYQDELARVYPERVELTIDPPLDKARLVAPEEIKKREDLHIPTFDAEESARQAKYRKRASLRWFVFRPWSLTPLFRRLAKTRRTAPETQEAPRLTPGCEEDARSDRPRIYWQVLPQEISEALRVYAKSAGASFNSILTSAVLQGVDQWRRSVDAKPNARRRYRTLIPINMRREEHARTPVANMIGYLFMDRVSDEIQGNERTFLQGIEEQIRRTVKWSLGRVFIKNVGLFRNVPGFIPFFASPIFCCASLIFSNLGQVAYSFAQPKFRDAKRIEIPGELKLLRMIGAPPVRVNTPVSVGSTSVGKETVLTFCVDVRVVAPQDGRALFDAIIGEFSKYRKESKATPCEK